MAGAKKAACHAGDARVTRGRERNSALFAAVLCLEAVQDELLGSLDVDSLARVAATCVAGRDAVEALGDEPWLDAIAAIERDLTNGELPPARAGVHTTAAARKAGEAAYASELESMRPHLGQPYSFMWKYETKYKEAHKTEVQRADKVRRARGSGGARSPTTCVQACTFGH
jgi:hypothetical protein